VEVLGRKIDSEMNSGKRVGNINDAAYLTSSKPVAASTQPVPTVEKGAAVPIDKKYDWY
jgi:hypothetical protein